jgi:hypothetical protein
MAAWGIICYNGLSNSNPIFVFVLFFKDLSFFGGIMGKYHAYW